MDKKGERRRSRKHALGFVVQWVGLAGAWLLFVGSFEKYELYVGAMVSTIAAVASGAVLERRIIALYARPRTLVGGVRLFRDIVRDSLVVLGELGLRASAAREPSAGLVAVPFGACGDDKRSVARRATAIVLTTISPNSIVLGFDRGRRLALFHQLRAAPTPPSLAELARGPS